MLRNFAVPFVVASLGLVGCLVHVKEDDDGFGGEGGDDVTTSTKAATVTTTVTATATTTTADTTVTSSSTGVGCVGETGTGVPSSDCSEVAGNLSECPGTGQPAVALSTCQRGYEIFTAGSWENLLVCLKAIPFNISDLCDEPVASDNVGNCTSKMYAEACPNAFAQDTCTGIDTVTCAQEGGFDVASCQAQLVPFSDAGINAYRSCIDESTTVPCSSLHETCLGQVISF